MGSILYQGSGIKILGEMGLRDQNNGNKIGINGSRTYHVTTLLGGQQTGHQLQTDMRQTWLWCKFYNLLNKDLILEIIENKAQPQRIEGIYTPLCCQL